MAERLGIHKVSFSRYFTEKRIPKRTVLEKIAAYFNVSTIDLIDKDFTQEHEKPAEPIRQIQAPPRNSSRESKHHHPHRALKYAR